MSTVLAARGPMGSGKSTLAASMPGRKFWFNLELGAHRAYGFKPEENELWSIPPDISIMTFAKGDRVSGQRENWQAIVNKLVEVCQRPDIDTVIFDTAKVAWTTCHRGFLQELQDDDLEKAQAKGPQAVANMAWRQTLAPIMYATPNQRFENLISFVRNFNKNLVLLNHERPVYIRVPDGKGGMTDEPAGDPNKPGKSLMELDGFKGTVALADWILLMQEPEYISSNGNRVLLFKAVIAKSPVGAELVGWQVIPPTWPTLRRMTQAQLDRVR